MDGRTKRPDRMKRTLASITAVLIIVAAALIARNSPSKPSVSWHDVTIDGLQAGITQPELEARFGPPTSIEDGLSAWEHEGLNGLVKFGQNRDGSYSLTGNSLVLDGRVLAEGVGARAPMQTWQEHGSLGSEIQALLGPGEIMVDGGPAMFHGGEEYGIRYRDGSSARAGGHELVVRFNLAHRGDGVRNRRVFDFTLLWRARG